MSNKIYSSQRLKQIDVIILSGGQGTRLRSVVNDRPKTMADINQRPFLDILINHVAGFGCQRFILSTGYQAEFIEDYYRKKNLPYEILFSQEDEPLGTGGAIKKATSLVKSNPFLVMNGDSFCAADLEKFYDFHLEKKASASMVVVKGKDSEAGGNIQLDNSQKIIQFSEKKQIAADKATSAGTVEAAARAAENTTSSAETAAAETTANTTSPDFFLNAGIYLFDSQILPFMPEQSKFSLEKDFFPQIIGKSFFGYQANEELIDIGTPERYLKAQKFFPHENRLS